MTVRIAIESADVSIGKVRILSGFSLHINDGEMVGLVGRNGAGKTTLLRAILGLLPTQRGDIRFAGASILSMPVHQRAALGIGYMPENRGLIGALSVRQNLCIPLWAQRIGQADMRMARVCSIMPELESFMASPAQALSGGQQKLVALARALLCGDRLVILDEPFEGVSPVLAQRLVEAVGRAREHGTTILLAESDAKGRRSGFDRIVGIERGANLE